ncbi:MAG: flagellar FliJ family protein [Nitrospirae bacterium]|nr:flagellar FliJ family protein [Nitrospirota bacterium]MBF0541064.1 flagellar FliJ family protein [Nitrospirota bacterium]
MSKLKTISRVLLIKEWNVRELESAQKMARIEFDTERLTLDTFINTLRHTEDSLDEKIKGRIANLYVLQMYYDYIETVNNKIILQQAVVNQKEAELSQKTDALIEGYKDKRLIEIMKEKAIKQENLEANRKEQKEIDYLWLSRMR